MSSSGLSTMTDFASCGFMRARSLTRVGDPLRTTSLDVPKSLTSRRISSVTSTGSSAVRTTIARPRSLRFASTSSEMTTLSLSLRPMMSVWPTSTTAERPRRRVSSLVSMPLEMMPMIVAPRKMPMRVTASIPNRNLSPSSPLKVPGSSDRVIASQTPSVRDVLLSEGPMPVIWMMTATRMTNRAVRTPSHSSTMPTPRASVLSMR